MPSAWYVRRPDGDYGVDLEVEIFENELTTGLTFRVQLKATDSPFTESPWVSVKTETLRYWRTLDSPVLLVRYDAPTQSLHARWSHSIKITDVETQRIRFADGDEVSASTPEELAAGARVIKSLRSGLYRRHIPLSLNFASNTSAIQENSFRRRLRSIAQNSGSLIRMVPSSQGSVTITFTEGDIVVALPTSLSTSKFSASNYAAATPGSATEQLLANDCIAAIALLMCNINATSEGIRIAQLTKNATSLWRHWEAAEVLADAFFVESDPSGALDYARDLLVDGDKATRDAGQRFMFPVVHQLDTLTARQRAEVAELHKSLISIEEASEKPSRAGAAHYNYGQLFAAQREWRAAANEYELAATWNPTYPKRDYWHRELAGYMFDIGRYEDSVKHYREALELIIDDSLRGEWEVLLSDALMMSGSYGEALDVLHRQPVPTEDKVAELGRLNTVILEEIVTKYGIRKQHIQTLTSPPGEVEEQEDWFKNSLVEYGALTPQLWVQKLTSDPEAPDAWIAAVTLATLLLNNAHAWFIATNLALCGDTSDELRFSIVRHALRRSRDEYLQMIEQFSQDAEPGHPEVLTYVEEVEAGLPDEVPTFTARLIFDPEDVREFAEGGA